ncbi:radical SAM family heme chaperone HemW [Planctomycetes bacterium Pan216]
MDQGIDNTTQASRPPAADSRDAATGATHFVPKAAYLHVPFCAHQCGYCDFASVTGRDDRRDDYLDALAAEMAAILDGPKSLRTIFIGGGTPTYLEPDQLDRLLELTNRWFPVQSLAEFTVEANPNTLTEAKVDVLARHGVNRVSLGAQSFEPRMLRALERDHDPESVGRAVGLLGDVGITNVSIDLIFGVPGQTLENWKSDLERAFTLPLRHLSAYGLTYEKGTKLWKERRLGIVQPVDEELERQMFDHVIDRTTAAGWDHYEVSNFAMPAPAEGEEAWRCEHNLIYWANAAYYGFGTGAAAYVDGERTLNTRELDAYIDRCSQGRSPISQRERLEPEPKARETLIVNLRRLDGVERTVFERQTGYSLDELTGERLPEFVSMGLLADDGERLRLTREGLPLADGILQTFL